jgi:hypothetical protein
LATIDDEERAELVKSRVGVTERLATIESYRHSSQLIRTTRRLGRDLAIARGPLRAPENCAPHADEKGCSISRRSQLPALPLVDVGRVHTDPVGGWLHPQLEPPLAPIRKCKLGFEHLRDSSLHRVPESREHGSLIDAGILLEDRMPDQFFRRPSAVPCRGRIHEHIMPVVSDDLESFLEAIERTTDRVVVQ